MSHQASKGLLFPYLRGKRLAVVSPFLRDRILGAGCDPGMLASIVAPENYLGVNIDQQSPAKARLTHPKHQFQSDFPATHSDFNTVIALAVIEHLPKPAKFLRSLTNLLASGSGGCIIIGTPHPSTGWLHIIGVSIGLFTQHPSESTRIIYWVINNLLCKQNSVNCIFLFINAFCWPLTNCR